MIRFLIVRILGPLIVILLIRAVIMAIARVFSESFRTPAPQQPRQASNFQTGGELKKDPVCGTYVSAGTAVTKTVAGKLVHFCSAECRDKFQAT